MPVDCEAERSSCNALLAETLRAIKESDFADPAFTGLSLPRLPTRWITYELSRHERQLEHAPKPLPEHAAVHGLLCSPGAALLLRSTRQVMTDFLRAALGLMRSAAAGREPVTHHVFPAERGRSPDPRRPFLGP